MSFISFADMTFPGPCAVCKQSHFESQDDRSYGQHLCHCPGPPEDEGGEDRTSKKRGFKELWPSTHVEPDFTLPRFQSYNEPYQYRPGMLESRPTITKPGHICLIQILTHTVVITSSIV